jgi:hypothetical protein
MYYTQITCDHGEIVSFHLVSLDPILPVSTTIDFSR